MGPVTSGADRRRVWLLFATFALHNLEEALTMRGFLGRSELLERVNGDPGVVFTAFLVAVSAVTLAALALAVAATLPEPRPWAVRGLRLLAVILVVNVVVPHVPAAVASGGYAPGVASSVAVVLPVSLLFLRKTQRVGSVARSGSWTSTT